MGGNAFKEELGLDVFPRIPNDVYAQLKEHFMARLKTLYALVGVPIEAPGKEDHGDVDFVVCYPLPLPTADAEKECVGDSDTVENDRTGPDHTTVAQLGGATEKAYSFALAQTKDVLGASCTKLAKGYDVSHFAVSAESVARAANISFNTENHVKGAPVKSFYQMDVHVCEDKASWERVMFFCSYGDLGLILGLIARGQGFLLGRNGLKTHFKDPDETHISSFVISKSTEGILMFFGLSMARWELGFTSREEILNWVKSSRFFVPRLFLPEEPLKWKRYHGIRSMYTAFILLSHACALSESRSLEIERKADEQGTLQIHGGQNSDEVEPLCHVWRKMEGSTENISSASKILRGRADILEECLVYFSKKEEYDASVKANLRHRALKKFNGNKIAEWTECNRCVGKLMSRVRESLGNDTIADMDEVDLRSAVIEMHQVIERELRQHCMY